VQPIFEEIQAVDAVGFYCPISWVELICYPNLTEAEANLMREFLRTLSCVSLTEAVLDRAADCTLVTRNVEDFRRVDGLNIVNPFEDG
jgi:hypothetical protein